MLVVLSVVLATYGRPPAKIRARRVIRTRAGFRKSANGASSALQKRHDTISRVISPNIVERDCPVSKRRGLAEAPWRRLNHAATTTGGRVERISPQTRSYYLNRGRLANSLKRFAYK
ncbi:unnamed protein product, partial [Iphiclides podalirius]